MILILGGTIEGREIADYLSLKGFKVVISVTTAIAKSLVENSIQVKVGKLDKASFAKLLKSKAYKAVVDATHPFAKEISKLAFETCSELDVPYLRFERAEIVYPEGVIFVDDFEEAARLIPAGNKVFAAIGVRQLQKFLDGGGFSPENVYVRVLPSSKEECLKTGVSSEHILTGIGPFSYEKNLAHFKAAGAQWLVTKASGPSGGEQEKIAVAQHLEMKTIVVKRPYAKGYQYSSKEKILQSLRGMTMQTGVIILAHGSKREETKETLHEIVNMVKIEGGFDVVEEAYLQFCSPTLADAVKKVVEQSIKQIVIVPYFLFKGIHNTEDIPGEIERLKAEYDGLEIIFGQPLGTDKRLAQILVERVREVSPWII